MSETIVAHEDELSEGDRIIAQVEGREVAVFNIDGEYLAYLNWCAHQAGPCGEGPLTGTLEGSYDSDSREVELKWTREGHVLNCPWHGWEYDITTGECLSNEDVLLPRYPVRVEDGDIIVSVR